MLVQCHGILSAFGFDVPTWEAFAEGAHPRNLFGGIMRAATLLFVATALGLTFVALGLLRMRLVSASCVNSFTAQSVPPGTTNGLGL